MSDTKMTAAVAKRVADVEAHIAACGEAEARGSVARGVAYENVLKAAIEGLPGYTWPDAWASRQRAPKGEENTPGNKAYNVYVTAGEAVEPGFTPRSANNLVSDFNTLARFVGQYGDETTRVLEHGLEVIAAMKEKGTNVADVSKATTAFASFAATFKVKKGRTPSDAAIRAEFKKKDPKGTTPLSRLTAALKTLQTPDVQELDDDIVKVAAALATIVGKLGNEAETKPEAKPEPKPAARRTLSPKARKVAKAKAKAEQAAA